MRAPDARVVQWVIWFAVMAVVMGWVARSRLLPPGKESSTLRHPPSLLVIGLVVGGMFLAMAVVSFNARTGGPGVAAVFAVFALLGAYLVAEYRVVRYEVREDGLAYRTLFSGSGQVSWPQIDRVSWSLSAKWLVLQAGSRRVRVSAMLRNLPVLARAIEQHVPRDRITAEAQTLLAEIAQGQLPKIWG